tara:strand:- start:2622 stop:3050 length:429 start_codon:yes stop_codon:yes gene_type:complete
MAQKEPRTDAMSQQRIVINAETFNEATEFIFKSMLRAKGRTGEASYTTPNWDDSKLPDVTVTLGILRAALWEKLENVDTLVKQQIADGNNTIPVYDPDGPDELKLPGCKCVNPPSNGFCLLGGCLFGSVGWGKGEVSFVFNI